jgi:hypothetical protein
VTATDAVGNERSAAISFRIVVTAESVKDAVRQLAAAGSIRNNGLAASLLSKLDAAAAARAAGNCALANVIYEAAKEELRAQSGKGLDATAAAIAIADIDYLIVHCP